MNGGSFSICYIFRYFSWLQYPPATTDAPAKAWSPSNPCNSVAVADVSPKTPNALRCCSCSFLLSIAAFNFRLKRPYFNFNLNLSQVWQVYPLVLSTHCHYLLFYLYFHSSVRNSETRGWRRAFCFYCAHRIKNVAEKRNVLTSAYFLFLQIERTLTLHLTALFHRMRWFWFLLNMH